MHKNPDPKATTYFLLATWPFAFVVALINRELLWLAMLWLPIGALAIVLVPGVWYIVRYIPDDIRRFIASRRP
jgi:uncharacterized membrane protein